MPIVKKQAYLRPSKDAQALMCPGDQRASHMPKSDMPWTWVPAHRKNLWLGTREGLQCQRDQCDQVGRDIPAGASTGRRARVRGPGAHPACLAVQ